MTLFAPVRRGMAYAAFGAALVVGVGCDGTDQGLDEGPSSATSASSSPTDDAGESNLRPVIGVFSQETDTITDSDSIDSTVEAELSAYRYMIPASYVNWIGQAGKASSCGSWRSGPTTTGCTSRSGERAWGSRSCRCWRPTTGA